MSQTSRIALVLSFLLAESLGWAQVAPAPQSQKAQGFIEAMLSDATMSQRYRPIPDPDRYLADMGDLQERTDDELQVSAEDLAKMRRIDGRNWQEIQRARQNSKFRLPLDQPIYVARLYEEANRKQREINRIDDEEDAAFRALNGFSMKPGFLVPTPAEREKIEQWTSARRGEPYHKRRAEVQERFRQRLEEISTEYRQKTDPGEKYLDQLQREVLSRYQRTLVVQRTIQAEIDRRRNVPPPPPEQPNEARAGSLLVSSKQSEYDLKVNEVADIEVTISGGQPTFAVWVKTLESTLAETSLAQPGTTSFPVSFAKDGTYTVSISVKDEANPVNEAILTLQFRVTDDHPTEPPAPQPPPQTKPTGPPKPQDATKPPDRQPPAYTPWKLAAGNYQALLWPGLSWLSHHRKLANPGSVPPFPLTLTFRDDGSFTGTLNWSLPDAEKDVSQLKPGAQVNSTVAGRVSGKANWTSGQMEWKLEQGQRMLAITEPSSNGKGADKSTWTIDFAYEFSGWQFQHPTFGTELARSLAYYEKKYGPPPAEVYEASGFPKYQVDSSGKWTFPDRGFGGVPGNDPSRKPHDTIPGPGGFAKLTMSRSEWVHVYPDRTDKRDDLQSLRRFWAEYSHWFLKIVGPGIAEPVSPTPARPPTIQGELTAFGLWPWGTVTVQSGEAFELDAMGVFLNDPYDAVNLSDKVTWTLPDGLVRGPDGKIRATKAGAFTARASLQRPDGRVMSDTIQITVR